MAGNDSEIMKLANHFRLKKMEAGGRDEEKGRDRGRENGEGSVIRKMEEVVKGISS